LTGLTESIRARGFSGDLRLAEKLADHCSIAVGGEAELFAVPEKQEDLAILLSAARSSETPLCLLGGGTNVIFTNGGYKGCVARLGGSFATINQDTEGLLRVGAATTTGKLLAYCRREGLSGLEFLAGIPGTVGGAVCMNAGVPGEEMSSVVNRADIYMGALGRTMTLGQNELEFAYRELRTLAADDVVLSVGLKVEKDDPEAIKGRMQERAARRGDTQPLGLPSAGCWFKNPPGDSAGRLIDAAGLKGLKVGGAQVSEVHANFLVNQGDATAAHFLELAGQVKDKVMELFGVTLEEEVHVY
jgi:UDP-N-acetylmuramate dehydrogenase